MLLRGRRTNGKPLVSVEDFDTGKGFALYGLLAKKLPSSTSCTGRHIGLSARVLSCLFENKISVMPHKEYK